MNISVLVANIPVCRRVVLTILDPWLTNSNFSKSLFNDFFDSMAPPVTNMVCPICADAWQKVSVLQKIG